MVHSEHESARLTVRLAAIAENYRACCRLAQTARVGAVVKADAYGLGAVKATKVLVAAGCDTFFAARLDEGIAIRGAARRARVFVLDGAQAETVGALLDYDLIPVLNSLDEIALWSQSTRGRDAAIHIDTGMSRLGLSPDELAVLSREAERRLSQLNLVLLMSHLACADDPGSSMNRLQLDRFREALSRLPAAPASLASSGGILLGREFAFDLVRPGIALYGGNPQPAGQNPFAVAARLTGRVLQCRRVDKGKSVGYGATFRVEGPMSLATVALGYADGLKRALGNRGEAAIAGLKVPIVGRVSMDLVTLDVSGIHEELTRPGAEVEFFGDVVRLDEVAAAADTAHYEILTGIGSRVRRHYEAAS